MKRGIFFISVLTSLSVISLMIINPTVCKNGAIYGLVLSSSVIIPSIFPFSVFVLFILKSNLLNKLKIFNLNPNVFSVFVLSLIGGYPIGAKLINEAVELKKIDKSTAKNMLNFCVNAGPAFIILAVGGGILNSKKLGYVLFFSHILSSLFLFAISKKHTNQKQTDNNKTNVNVIENFVSSVSESAAATLSICSFIVVFSVILNYLNFYSNRFEIFKKLRLLIEVTNAISQTKNIIFISFLLGFSGICVWFQVFSQVKNFKIHYFKFILFRILHGLLSGALTFLFLKFFKISVPTFSNGINAHYNLTNSDTAVALSLIIMGIVFIISLYHKNYTGNLLEDLV